MYELLDSNYNRKRIDDLYQLILEVAKGNFDIRGTVTDKMDDIDAISAGINMLLEELKSSTVSRDYFNGIYESIVDMVFIFNNQGYIISTNNEAKRVLQYTDEELNGLHFSVFLDKNSKNNRKLYNSLRQKKNFHSIEKVLVTKNGDRIFTTCSGSLFYDTRNKANGILCISRDISNLKKFEKALLNKNKEMDMFLYKASHDLKGPLLSIKGLANVAKMQSQEAETMKFLSMIAQTAEKLNNTLVTILKLAVSDNILKEKRQFNIAPAIESVLKQLNIPGQANSINIKLEVDPELSICANEVIFCTIIQNLVENGIKYRKNGTSDYLRLEASKKNNILKITIEDNGIGISHAAQGKIFDMFYRANSTQEGSGLGLYIVQSHVEKLSGSISFESTIDQGSTFTIKLPDLT